MSLEFANVLRRVHVSKHRRYDEDEKWIPGKCRIVENSSLRKLMRAARRGLVPHDRLRLIVGAMQSAARHPTLHMGPKARERYTLAQLMGRVS